MSTTEKYGNKNDSQKQNLYHMETFQRSRNRCSRQSLKERTFEGVVFPFRHCKFTTYTRRKRIKECIYPRLSNVSNSFAVFLSNQSIPMSNKKGKRSLIITLFFVFPWKNQKIILSLHQVKTKGYILWTRDSHHVQTKRCLLQCEHFRHARRLSWSVWMPN